MRRFYWLLVWIALGGGQVLFVYLAGHSPDAADEDPPLLARIGDGLKVELLELARMTNEEWERLRTPARAPRLHGDGEPLLQREEALLKLERMQMRLQTAGVDIDLVRLLRSWWRPREESYRADGREIAFNRYLAGLIAMVEPFVETPTAAVPRRIYLSPDPISPFPVIGFELEGPPEAMGRCLLERANLGDSWTMRELELFEATEDAPWWLRGLYAFEEAG